MTITIPAIGLIAASIITGSPWVSPDNHIEAQEILQTSVYKYAEYDAYGAHDYREFKDLHRLRRNAVVIIDGIRYHVDKILTVDQGQTGAIEEGTTLFTCTANPRDRLIIKLR